MQHLLDVFVEGLEARIGAVASDALLPSDQRHEGAVILAQRHRRPENLFVLCSGEDGVITIWLGWEEDGLITVNLGWVE